MPSSIPLETFTAGQETFVDVPHIERQLAALWAAAAGSAPEHAARSITRASVFNLVVYCETDEAREHTTETISELTSRHPCRALVLQAEPDAAAAALSASITAHCHLAAGGGKQVCCEQITLQARGADARKLPGAVWPLLEPDLPTLLWWQGDFLGRAALFARLSDTADRVFFDTSTWERDARRREWVGPLVGALADQPRGWFCDLSWTRLLFWRELTADLFEPADCRTQLNRIRAVRLEHGRGPGAEWRAMLYGGWLAAQLNWPAAAARERLRLTARDAADAAGMGLLGIELTTEDATFLVRKDHGDQAAISLARLARVCELPRHRAFWPTDDASVLGLELDRPTRHLVYERALGKTREIWI